MKDHTEQANMGETTGAQRCVLTVLTVFRIFPYSSRDLNR